MTFLQLTILHVYLSNFQVLPKKQKQLIEIPATVTLWEEFDPVIIKSEDLVLKEILGTGNFGQVYQAEWIRRSGGNEMKVRLVSISDSISA